MKHSLSLCIALILLAGTAQARPLSYPGGTMLMFDNDVMQNNVFAGYTVDPKNAFGYRLMYDRETASTFHGAQWNHLLNRWNNPDSQANLYLQSAVGVIDRQSEAPGQEYQPGAMTGILADWEDRRFFVSYENKVRIAEDEQWRNFTQSGRLGIAPYVAEAGSLHTWLMVQFDHRPQLDDTFTTTPLVRLFYDSYLVEAGYNIDEQTPLVNLMIHF
ncbi:MAG TPA: hypothetical protein VGF14_05520 [Alphaproteobacteria bacterium]